LQLQVGKLDIYFFVFLERLTGEHNFFKKDTSLYFLLLSVLSVPSVVQSCFITTEVTENTEKSLWNDCE
jgi:hypothetical protein